MMIKEKNMRYAQVTNTSDFYNYILNINLFNKEIPSLPEIPIGFRHGGEYINCFQPCFFEEVKAEILSSLNQIDGFSLTTVICSVHSTKEGFGYLNVLEAEKSRFNFHLRSQAEDIVLIIPYEEYLEKDLLKNFSTWPNFGYVLGIVERNKISSPLTIRVLEEVLEIFEKELKCFIAIVNTSTTVGSIAF